MKQLPEHVVMSPPSEEDAPPSNRRLTQADIDAICLPRNPNYSSLCKNQSEFRAMQARRREHRRAA